MIFAAFNQGVEFSLSKRQTTPAWGGGGGGAGSFGIFAWGCAAGTLEPLAYTSARASEFCYPLLD